MDRQNGAAALALILYALLARAFATYDTKRVFDFEYAAKRMLVALLLTFSALLFISGAVKVTNIYSRLWFFSWAALVLTVPLAFRYAGLRRIRWRIRAGDFVFKAVSASLYCEPLAANRILCAVERSRVCCCDHAAQGDQRDCDTRRLDWAG